MKFKEKVKKADNSEGKVEEQYFGLKDDFIKEIADLLDNNELEALQKLCRDMAAEDSFELIMKLNRHQRRKFVETLEGEINPETFSHLDKNTLNDLLEHMSPSYIASMINELESDDAIHIIEELEESRRGNVIRHLNRKLRMAVEEGLSFPEDSAGRLMQREMVAVPQFWTVGKTIDYLRAAAESLPEKFYNVFIIDPRFKAIGEVDLSAVLSSPRTAKIQAIMREDFVTVNAATNQQDVAHLFRRKDLLSAAVVDENEHLIGVITIDDIVDVIHEETEKDLLQLSGVNDTDIHLQAISTANSRFIWLVVNLVTAILASLVIDIFESTIAQLATLAVLMPIVASMGGNAGTQTLAVTVRALASRDLSSVNSKRVIFKECLVGIINGVLFSLIIGSLVFLWADNLQLGLVIAAAMIVNLFFAGFSGAAIPIAMDKMGIDPAQAAAVFLTTVTDVVGFFAFLALAKWFLI